MHYLHNNVLVIDQSEYIEDRPVPGPFPAFQWQKGKSPGNEVGQNYVLKYFHLGGRVIIAKHNILNPCQGERRSLMFDFGRGDASRHFFTRGTASPLPKYYKKLTFGIYIYIPIIFTNNLETLTLLDDCVHKTCVQA